MAVKKKSTAPKKSVPKKETVKTKIVRAKPAAKQLASREKTAEAVNRGRAQASGRQLTAEGWKRMMLRKKKEQKAKK